MSRGGVRDTKPKPARTSGTPIWVWVVYAVGIFAGTILVGSALFTIGGLFLSDTGKDYYPEISILGFVLWGGLLLLAVGLWVWRRRGRR